MIVFPETALSGYDDLEAPSRAEKMQVRLAELIPGPSTAEAAVLAEKYQMFIVCIYSVQSEAEPPRT